MAKQRSRFGLFTWVLIASLEVLLVMLFVSAEYAHKEMNTEAQYIHRSLGAETTAEITQRANAAYKVTVLDTDLEGWLRRLYIPTEEQKARSKGLESLGEQQGVWAYAEERIEALLDMIYWICRRLALFSIWLPVWIPAFLLAFRLGWLERGIKKAGFAYTSPQLLGLSAKLVGLSFCALISTFVFPMATYPEVVPLFFASVVILVGFGATNIQKRI